MDKQSEQLVQLRKDLHRHPEVSGDEKQTSGRIKYFLEQLSLPLSFKKLGGEGLLVTIDTGMAGPTILFRSELDALPIQEVNEFEYRSKYTGVSHKCGHDGHMAILCGLAQKLSIDLPTNGIVYLLFQPAEETGEGAAQVAHDPAFTIKPD
jgi:amidohydrolase